MIPIDPRGWGYTPIWLKPTPGDPESSSPFQIYFAREFTANTRVPLVPVVGVDVEAEEGVDFNRLCTAHGGTELPAWQRGHNLCSHSSGTGFEDLQISQVAGRIEFAFDHDTRAGKIGGQI